MNRLDNRKFVVLMTFMVIGLIFIIRLLFVQGIDDKWKQGAHAVSENRERVRAFRGEVYDRNGVLLVANVPRYDVMVTPNKVRNIDTLALCELVGIEKADFIRKIEKAKHVNGWRKPSTFMGQISPDDISHIREQLYKYPGFSIELRTYRGYPEPIGAHVLGYTGEVSQKKLDTDPFYKLGDYHGLSGIERYYEDTLRGIPGVRYLLKDTYGNKIESVDDGNMDTIALPGPTIYTSLDAELQAYGELLMRNKKGSIVAIEPATGEILALVSSPNYDPNLMVGRERGKNYMSLLNNDSLAPLMNRATTAKYPPGSIFKLVQALIALEEGVITENTSFPCNKGLVGCHNHGTSMNVAQAVQHSCNPYFYMTAKRIINQGRSRSIFKDTELGMDPWKEKVETFGIGTQLETDLPGIKSGQVPGTDYYNKIYGQGRWAYSTIYSISIGQGEVEMVPLQMANLAAIMANRGYYYTPHLVRQIGEDGQKLPKYRVKNYTCVSPEHFPFVIEGMRRVVAEAGGTARRARIPGMDVCGKTGTAENPHGEDHSVFIAFAPMDNPKIAIAVFVENSGFGGTWSAPIASLMIEKFVNDSIADPRKEQRILEANLLDVKVND